MRRYRALAADYDGTLASNGIVKSETLAALRRLRESGTTVILITGRQLEDLLRLFQPHGIVDRVVAENGAVVFSPDSGDIQIRGDRPSEAFIHALQTRGVSPLSVGRVIVATEQPHETVVRKTIRDFELGLQVILNKDAVMILPAGIDKASGLRAVLTQLGTSPRDTVGVGDAENDAAFLEICGCAAVVINAVPALKEKADWISAAPDGDGVIELIDRLSAP